MVRGCVFFEVSLNTVERNVLLMPLIQSRSLGRSAPSLVTVMSKICQRLDEEESVFGKGVEGRGRHLTEHIIPKSS